MALRQVNMGAAPREWSPDEVAVLAADASRT
jgi:hypothetical protein